MIHAGLMAAATLLVHPLVNTATLEMAPGAPSRDGPSPWTSYYYTNHSND